MNRLNCMTLGCFKSPRADSNLCEYHTVLREEVRMNKLLCQFRECYKERYTRSSFCTDHMQGKEREDMISKVVENVNKDWTLDIKGHDMYYGVWVDAVLKKITVGLSPDITIGSFAGYALFKGSDDAVLFAKALRKKYNDEDCKDEDDEEDADEIPVAPVTVVKPLAPLPKPECPAKCGSCANNPNYHRTGKRSGTENTALEPDGRIIYDSNEDDK